MCMCYTCARIRSIFMKKEKMIMNFTMNGAVLKEIVKRFGSMLTAKVSRPILEGVLIEVSTGGIIMTAATEGDMIAQRITDVEVNEVGATVIPRDFLKSISALTGTIEFVLEGHTCTVTRRKTVLTTQCLLADDFPRYNATEPTFQISYTGDQWQQAISSTAYAASDSESRPALTGINLKVNENEQLFVCTDSHRLARYTLKNTSMANNLNITLPAKALSATLQSFDLEKTVIVVGFANHISVMNNNVIYNVRAIEGIFPQTERLLPSSYKTTVKVNRKHLLDEVKLLHSMLKHSKHIKGELTEEGLTLLSQLENKSGTTFVEIDTFEGEGLTFAFDATYLLDTLLSYNDEYVNLNFNEPLQPITVSGEVEGQLGLILPIRIYDTESKTA